MCVCVYAAHLHLTFASEQQLHLDISGDLTDEATDSFPFFQRCFFFFFCPSPSLMLALFAAMHRVMVSISLKVGVGDNSHSSQLHFLRFTLRSTGNDTSGAFKK